jgi:hypothetical protein
MNCKFYDINKDNLIVKCNKKCNKNKYGGFCYKHRDNYLLKENIIDYDKFTYISSDYTIINLKNTLKFNNIKSSREINKYNKDQLYLLICNSVNNYKYSDNIYNIIKIQSNIRRYLNNILSLRGVGYLYRDKCKNDEDFFYFISKQEIEDKYFFSYKDQNNHIWCFDIRSFNKLIANDKRNPYTRELIGNNVINKSKNLTKYLIKKKVDINIEEFNHENKIDRIRQKTVDLFSSISQTGYEININWFLSLNITSLKKLYKSLEDIWNYRAYITPENKRILIPPNGLIFRYPVREVYLLEDKLEIMEIILNEISKSNNAVDLSDKQQGYMYFLIGLSEVSNECLNSHEWIQYAISV